MAVTYYDRLLEHRHRPDDHPTCRSTRLESSNNNRDNRACTYGVSALRSVGLGRVGLGVVVAKDTGPLLDGLVVVVGQKRAVGRAVVDLHLRPASIVVGVHCATTG